MGSSVLAEIVTLIRDHPYISCSLLVFLTPPFFPILKFFSPLLISTALFLVALVTMGPQFEDPSEQERELQSSSEVNNAEDEIAGPRAGDVVTRDLLRKKPRKGLGDWLSSCKESGLMWVEQKLRNENWRGASLNDENVSILQEAFAHRAEEKPRVMVKLVTRRIPAEEESIAEEHTLQRQGVSELSNSGSWNSFHASSGRSFETSPPFTVATTTRDLPHDFFSPHQSLSRRLDSDASMFDNVEPPPIEHDMPPQITGPASDILKYIEDASDSDGYDHHHSDHDEDMHLEFGERSLDAESISQDELSLANGTYGQPPPFTVQEEDLPSSSGSDEGRHYFADLHQGNMETESSLHEEVHNRDIDLHDQQAVDAVGAHEDTAPRANDVPEEHAPPSAEILHEEHSAPAPVISDESHPPATLAHEESPQVNDDTELHDIPELEDVLPVENEIHEVPAAAEESVEPVPDGELHTDVILGDVPAEPEAPEVPAEPEAPEVPVEPEAPEVPAEPEAPEVPTDHTADSEVLHKDLEDPPAAPAAAPVPADVPEEPHHFVERSMSMPVAGSLESATVHEDLTHLHTSLPDVQEPAHQPRVLGNAISLPASSNLIHPLIIPPNTADQGPLSPDTDLGYTTTPDHERRGAARRFNSIASMSGDESELAVPVKILSTKEKLSNLEALCNSMPSPSSGEVSGRRALDVSILRATTDEQVIHVSDKLRAYKEDSPSKKFQPDAPQLQITPPSTKVVLTPSKSAFLAQTIGRPSIRQVASSTRTFASDYVSSSSSSDSEEIELDSDPEAGDGSESESDFETHPAGPRLKPPPKPPLVQGKNNAEPVKK